MKRTFILIGFLITLFSNFSLAQNFWTQKNESEISVNKINQNNYPSEYAVYELNVEKFKEFLAVAPLRGATKSGSDLIVSFPTSNGEFHNYSIIEAPVFDDELSAQYPQIKSYAGQGIENPAETIRFSVSPLGIKSLLISPDLGHEFLEPYSEDLTHYIIYNTRNRQESAFECKVKHEVAQITNQNEQKNNADDGILRTYRLAVSTTGEYTAHFGTGTVADALAAINATMTNANALFEKDFSITMTVIATTTNVIYTNAATDPYSNDNGWSSEVQTTLTNLIGEANYDIGHLFAKGPGGGSAGCIGCVCEDEEKGSGYSADASNPQGYDFDIDLLTHEFGHQFGANHTWTHDGDEETDTQMEPGSGSTNMSYAGITGATDVEDQSGAYFHAISIQQVTNYIKSTSCQVNTNTGNTVPTVNAGSDYTIPKGTPFVLTGTASDPDGDALTYCWEQMDENNAATTIPSPTATTGVAFRSRPPSTSNQRTFPEIAAVLAGSTTPMWEVVPNVGRALNFRLTVRDNRAGGGTNESDDMLVTVDGSIGPFVVTQPNSLIAWPVGSTQTVTWDVAGTTGAPVNTSNVNILLSTDGGMTFPTTLATNVANDGSETITVPNMLGDFNRIRIEAVGNIFFDISNIDFTIGDIVAPTYCAANGDDPSEDYIGNVTIGSINNTTGESDTGYGNYTSLSTTLIKGTSESISITPVWTAGAGEEGYGVWIDFNKDGDFSDAGEMVLSQPQTQTTPVMGSFTVPTGAITGTTRMRVALEFENIPSPCGTIDFGEVEDYTVLITTALPVEWLDFQAIPVNSQKVQLKWATASERNTQSFIVERSSNGLDFFEIAKLDAAGQSDTQRNYSTVDEQPLSGISYYRIRQIDRDGSYSFSAVETVSFTGTSNPIFVYPNPIAQGMELQIDNQLNEDLEIEIFSSEGRLVLQKSIETGNGRIVLNHLPTGAYFYRVISGTVVQAGQLIIE